MSERSLATHFPDLSYYEASTADAPWRLARLRAHAIIKEIGEDRSTDHNQSLADANWEHDRWSVELREHQESTFSEFRLAIRDTLDYDMPEESYYFNTADIRVLHAVGEDTPSTTSGDEPSFEASVAYWLDSAPLDRDAFDRYAKVQSAFWRIASRSLFEIATPDAQETNYTSYIANNELRQLLYMPTQERSFVQINNLVWKLTQPAGLTADTTEQPLTVHNPTLVRQTVLDILTEHETARMHSNDTTPRTIDPAA